MSAGVKPRARDLGIPFDGTPGPLNALTDVIGVEVGHTTLIAGEGRRFEGQGPVRTGVTAVHPRGKHDADPVFAAWFALNGNGEMTGTAWIDDSGFLTGPVLLTNTHSVGVVRDAAVRWMHRQHPGFRWALPVVSETWDGLLSDINGHHVTSEHAFAALDGAAPGPVAEGNVGGGTGMICHGFKGGIGTASRITEEEGGGWTLGVLAQCNHGRREELRVAGVSVGKEIPDLLPGPPAPTGRKAAGVEVTGREGSIVVILATDAPLIPHQLRHLARRAALGVTRVGGVGETTSGDLFLAFSTANRGAGAPAGTPEPAGASVRTRAVLMLPNEDLDPLYYATVQAVEEAIVNALVAAETMTGADRIRVHALPHDRLRDALRTYGRLGRISS
ncbi:MAG TPA: P1 family peptidase [Gemmatimonadota bacterium]|nr:P1 family peptidase [Gemmatimonadota bacterium]